MIRCWKCKRLVIGEELQAPDALFIETAPGLIDVTSVMTTLNCGCGARYVVTVQRLPNRQAPATPAPTEAEAEHARIWKG